PSCADLPAARSSTQYHAARLRRLAPSDRSPQTNMLLRQRDLVSLAEREQVPFMSIERTAPRSGNLAIPSSNVLAPEASGRSKRRIALAVSSLFIVAACGSDHAEGVTSAAVTEPTTVVAAAPTHARETLTVDPAASTLG